MIGRTPLCHGHIQRILDPGAVNGDHSPIPEQKLHAAGVHVEIAISCIVLHVHPFKVLDDESMQRTVESVEQYGVLSPLIARPRPEGGYEIISGHRRQHAAQLAGLDTLPVIVRQMDDNAAVLLMVL